MQGAIYQSYLSHSRPFQLPVPWQKLRADRCAYLAPASVDDAWQELSANYSETELIDAGLAQLDAEGKLNVHPALAVPDAPLVALTDPKTNNIVNLLAEEGCITGGLPPVLAILADGATRKAIRGIDHELFLTGDLKDTILLRSLGMAAVPVWGLSNLGEQELIRLGKLFEINVPSPSGHGAANEETLPTSFQSAQSCRRLSKEESAHPRCFSELVAKLLFLRRSCPNQLRNSVSATT